MSLMLLSYDFLSGTLGTDEKASCLWDPEPGGTRTAPTITPSS